MTRPILALDLATTTGWAFYGGEGAGVSSGAVTFAADGDTGDGRFDRFREWLEIQSFAGRLVPDGVIAYEKPHLRGADANRVLQGFVTALQGFAAATGVELLDPVHTGTLKKLATGSGRASKEDMVEAARVLFPTQEVKGHDQADALHVLVWAASELDVDLFGAVTAGGGSGRFRRLREVEHLLAVELEPEEVKAKGVELAQAHKRLRHYEGEKKKAAADWKAKIDHESARIDDLARVVRSGEEERPVLVELVADLEERKVRTRRTDTGEIVAVRALSAAELEGLQQSRLFEEDDPENADTPEEDGDE